MKEKEKVDEKKQYIERKMKDYCKQIEDWQEAGHDPKAFVANNLAIVDEFQLEELCEEISGNRKLLDDSVKKTLNEMVEHMVDNVIDTSAQFAKLRSSDSLEKSDMQMAIQKMFPDLYKQLQ